MSTNVQLDEIVIMKWSWKTFKANYRELHSGHDVVDSTLAYYAEGPRFNPAADNNWDKLCLRIYVKNNHMAHYGTHKIS